MNMPTRDPEPTWNPTYNQNPSQFDNALVTRASLVCGGGNLAADEYNLELHVAAVFIVLAQSTLACAFPIIAKRFPQLRIPPNFLFYARHFGTGVLIATAFVHLLPTAFISLLDPCLSPIWNEDYPAMAGAIAMGAVFFVTIVEMVFMRGVVTAGEGKSGEGNAVKGMEGGQQKGLKRIFSKKKNNNEKEGVESDDGDTNSMASEKIGGEGGLGHTGFGMIGKRRSRGHSMGQELRRLEEHERNRASLGADIITPGGSIYPLSPNNGGRFTNYHFGGSKTSNIMEDVEEEADTDTDDHGHEHSGQDFGHGHGSTRPRVIIPMTPEQAHKKALLQCALLEMGILFHSVFIGMAISVSTGPGFIVLLIAICFHQTFEGLALGSRIAGLKWADGVKQPWLMALAYGLTTPIGQALGLATRSLYSPESETGLLVVGIMNAISSGLLVFAGLVELLAEDFLSDESWSELRGSRRIIAFIAVVAGAAGMSIVGAWA
jgi:zinc transporter ZupT